MKVALINRTSMYSVKGGDTIQVLKTAEGLNQLGVTAEVFKASETIPYHEFDLLHFFNIIRPADHLKHIRRSGKPYVVSTIYLDYSLFDKYGRRFPFRHLFSVLGKSSAEYCKNMHRYINGQDKLVSRSYILGHRRSMKKVLAGASLLLPNSTSEYERLAVDLGIKNDHHVVPNGIDSSIFSDKPTNVPREEKVLSVGQIYGMKNQHLLIQACGELGYELEIVGKPPPNHAAYYNYCRSIAGNTVKFIDFMPQEELIQRYASAKVHALPSWFETTGLTSLEAGAMGCKLVVSKHGDTRDYFGEHAFYCDPKEPATINQALIDAMEAQEEPAFRDIILREFTWEKAAEETLLAYKKVLDEKR